MEKDRVQAFSDGVIAILITIMVLELEIPHGSRDSATASALQDLVPVFLTYVLSFVYLGIYWNNHHHLLDGDAAGERRGVVGQPASAVLAFALPVLHRLDGSERFRGAARGRVRRGDVHGRRRLLHPQDHDHRGAGTDEHALAEAMGRDFKGKISPVIYAVAIPLAFVNRWIAVALYVVVSLMWLVPDRRIESRIEPGVGSRRTPPADARPPPREPPWCRAPGRSAGNRCTTSACPRTSPSARSPRAVSRCEATSTSQRTATHTASRPSSASHQSFHSSSCERHLVDDHVDSRPCDLTDGTAVRAHQPPRRARRCESSPGRRHARGGRRPRRTNPPTRRPRPTAPAASPMKSSSPMHDPELARLRSRSS